MQVNLKHNQTGAVKQTKLGFSWTTLFFGLFVPLFRGDFKWFAFMIIFPIITFGIAWLIFPFIYNKMYIKDLIEKGYIPSDDYSKSQLQLKGLAFQTT